MAGRTINVRIGQLPSSPVLPKPGPSNSGPRITPSGPILDGINAVMAVADANDGVVEGRIIRNVQASQPGHVFTTYDCDVSGLRGIDAWFGTPGVDVFPPADDQRIVLNYTKVHDCSADGIAGRNIETHFCDFEKNGDHFKPLSNTVIRGCYFHDFWSDGEDPHGDVIQLFGGTDILIEYNTMIAKNSLDSPTFPGINGNAVLQPSVGEPIVNFRFLHNWVYGGTITLRGAEDWGGMPANLLFRDNIHGDDYGSFPITGMGSFNGGLAISDYDLSNIFESTGLPVLGGF